MFYPMVQTILERLPGGASLPVQYPAGVAQNTTSGERFVMDTINEGLRDCPGQEYALFGYSQGATLMLRALSQLSEEATGAVRSVVLVGNPYRLPGKVSNVNGTGQPSDDDSVGLFVGSATAQNETIPQLSDELDKSGRALDYCLEVSSIEANCGYSYTGGYMLTGSSQGDGVCASDAACSCQLPAGHLSYGLVASVHDTAVEHVISWLSANATQEAVE